MEWLCRRTPLALGLLVLAACSHDGPTGPKPEDLLIGIQSGDQQIGAARGELPNPLRVLVKDATRGTPVEGVTVTWRAVAGVGAILTPSQSQTDAAGIASARLTLGSALGTYTVEATFDGNVGSPAEFNIRAAAAATIVTLTPTSATAGDTITITGENFSPDAVDNAVLFDGVRGSVASATNTRLRVVVPTCIPTRTVKVVVWIGLLASAPVSFAVRGTTTPPLQLEIGQAITIGDPAGLACARLPAATGGALYLLVVQNATSISDRPMPFQLRGLGSGSAAQTGGRTLATAEETYDAISDWEWALRRSERALARTATVATPPGPSTSSSQPPRLGDTRTFSVYNGRGGFTEVKAAARAISPRAIIYEDQNVPANGLTSADYDRFARLFDDPIYDTNVSVYGTPSDIDGNRHILILFTPVVNQQTPAAATSFIAGFFYGCDLLSARDCSGTNRGEIFYSVVPDPTGRFGLVQPKSRVMETVPPILAHEFMHMIHFNQRVLLRNAPDESLWLAEALAHTAEDTVGAVFLSRGDTATGIAFQRQNWERAFRYLQQTAGTSLLTSDPRGTLEERGAGWLFVKYLTGRFGGRILGGLTRTSVSSTANVAQQTAISWSVLVNDWSLALYAANELDTPQIDSRYTFVGFRLRQVLGQPAMGGSYPLSPRQLPFGDFAVSDSVLSGSSAYALIRAPAGAAPLAVGFAGSTRGPFEDETVPQLAILRLR